MCVYVRARMFVCVCVCVHKQYLALNNPQGLIHYKMQPTKTK